MNLLFHQSTARMTALANKVFDRQFLLDPALHVEYDERRKMLMYEDILSNLGYLDAAVILSDDQLFTNYAVWLYHLLCSLMKDLDQLRIRDQMVMHYQIMSEEITGILSGEEAQHARLYLSLAIEATDKECGHLSTSGRFADGSFFEISKDYLQCMINGDTAGAFAVIRHASDIGIALPSVYVGILQEVMYEVGNLWQQNKMTVDKEHYCTSTTQVALSQFYPVIFSTPRNRYKILTCCVGSELHEMGIRMVSDIFEYRGWDSIYLGAAVPKEAILHAIQENHPDLLALSVTMPQHLPICLEIVNAVREKYDNILIAVGGRAFQTTNRIWEKWDVDIYTEDANQLADWADSNIIAKRMGCK